MLDCPQIRDLDSILWCKTSHRSTLPQFGRCCECDRVPPPLYWDGPPQSLSPSRWSTCKSPSATDHLITLVWSPPDSGGGGGGGGHGGGIYFLLAGGYSLGPVAIATGKRCWRPCLILHSSQALLTAAPLPRYADTAANLRPGGNAELLDTVC